MGSNFQNSLVQRLDSQDLKRSHSLRCWNLGNGYSWKLSGADCYPTLSLRHFSLILLLALYAVGNVRTEGTPSLTPVSPSAFWALLDQTGGRLLHTHSYKWPGRWAWSTESSNLSQISHFLLYVCVRTHMHVQLKHFHRLALYERSRCLLSQNL